MSLPKFKSPPVTEVALGIDFPPLRSLRNLHVGEMWRDIFQKDFPQSEERAPLSPQPPESYAPRAQTGRPLRVETGPPISRYWFINRDGTELLQVQRDMFIRNWRRSDDTIAYPSYSALLPKFRDDYGKFASWLEKRDIGEPEPRQCEITYVNDLPVDKGWSKLGDLDKVLAVWQDKYSDGFLQRPEEVRLMCAHIIKNGGADPVGRLRITLEPRLRADNLKPLLRLTLTARGAPIGSGLEGVLAFMDVGHEWIVRGFASVTTEPMHTIWGRYE